LLGPLDRAAAFVAGVAPGVQGQAAAAVPVRRSTPQYVRGALPTASAPGAMAYSGWASFITRMTATGEVQRMLSARELLLAFYASELGPDAETGTPGLHDAESRTIDLHLLVDAAQLLSEAIDDSAKWMLTACLCGSTYFAEHVVSLFNAFLAHPDAIVADLRWTTVRAIASGAPEPRHLALGHVGSSWCISRQNFVIDVLALTYLLIKYVRRHWARTSRAPTPTEEEDMFFQAVNVLDVLKDRVRLSGVHLLSVPLTRAAGQRRARPLSGTV
jgi:hypothetical protein